MGDRRKPGVMTGVSLLLPITLSTMAIVLLAPILPALMEEFKDVPNHEYWAPMILTAPALCVAFLSPVAGVLGDFFGRRRLLIWSFVLYAAIGVAPVFLDDIFVILATRIGVGVAEALIMVLTTTMIGDYFSGPVRDKWLAAQTAFASMSALVFFNLGGQLGAFGWRTPFWVYGSALLMMVLVLAFTWEPKGDNAASEGEAAGSAPHNASWDGFPWGRMSAIIATTVFGSIFFYTVQIQAAPGLVALGLSDPARIGFLTSIASIGVPLGTLLFSLASRLPVGWLLLAAFGLLTAGFLLMSRAADPDMFLAGCFVNQLGAGILLPTLLVWAMSLLTFQFRARGAGMWNGAFSVGQFLSAIVVTFVSGKAGGLLPAFGVLSAAAAVGAAGALLLAFGQMRGRKSQVVSADG